MNATDSTNPEGQQPQGPTKRMNWAQRHPGWILLLVIIGSPFVIYGIVVGVGMLLVLFAPSSSSVADAAFRGVIAFTPVLYIMIIIFGVRWYREKKRQGKTIADCGRAIESNPSDADVRCGRGDD